MQKNIFNKIWSIIKKQKMLRTLSLLSVIFAFMTVAFLFTGFSYGKKIAVNQLDADKNEQSLLALQKQILTTENKDGVNISLFQNKSFADYDEVIPFIALLEKMFSAVDPNAEIAIRSQENQIFIDHFADYKVNLKLSEKEILFNVLDELYNSRFITKIMNFSMSYKTYDDGKPAEFSDAEFTVRLYLK